MPEDHPLRSAGVAWWQDPRSAQWNDMLPEIDRVTKWSYRSEAAMGYATYNFDVADGKGGKMHIRVRTKGGGQLVSMSKWYEEPPPPLDDDELRAAGEMYGPAIVDFCRSHEGEQVGNGECWTLANEALMASGARQALSLNFGQQIDMERAQAGDIIQFWECRFEWTTSDGGSRWVTAGNPIHTAVITGRKGEKAFDVLEQNIGGVRQVQPGSYNFAHLTKGRYEFWRATHPVS